MASSDTSVATVDSGDVEVFGDSLTGTVALTAGKWMDWTEAGGDAFLARYQKFNVETAAIIMLAVYKDDYQAGSDKAFAEAIRESMQDDQCTGIELNETTIGGQKAYVVSGKYPDGTYLHMWFFMDGSKVHVISLEYADNDTTSYDMLVSTYNYG